MGVDGVAGVTVIAVGGLISRLDIGIFAGIESLGSLIRIGGRSGADFRGGRRGGAAAKDGPGCSRGESKTTFPMGMAGERAGEGRRGGNSGLTTSDISSVYDVQV